MSAPSPLTLRDEERDAAAAEEVLAPLARASDAQGLAALAGRLLELRRWLEDDLVALEAGLGEHSDTLGAADDKPDAPNKLKVARAAGHLLELPGKRIRPLCVMVAARLGGRTLDDEVRDVAVACELVHAATLLHDDVVDEGEERRGSLAARVVFGNAASVLAGDHLLLEALRLVQRRRNVETMDALLQVMSRMVAAEALQLERRGQLVVDRETYLEVVRGKTAALFGFGLVAGGRLGGLSSAQCNALGRVGQHLGTAFQLTDDVLDLTGDPSLTGKEALRDVYEGKMTWPLLLAAEREPSLLLELKRFVRAAQPAVGSSLTHIVAKVHKTGALAQTATFARREAALALEALEELPEGRARAALGCIIESAVQRLA